MNSANVRGVSFKPNLTWLILQPLSLSPRKIYGCSRLSWDNSYCNAGSSKSILVVHPLAYVSNDLKSIRVRVRVRETLLSPDVGSAVARVVREFPREGPVRFNHN